ncbi:MAG: hypothetical protein CVV27_06190 [Candidatus Melainabacteria bacterium HGW-Melainabacteria-1]|nr:MAG: hypothetical protein CVV27_06190 [Candidatus Melainabacteria bacterium HGW-Melainabacteria-1]
MLKVKMFEGPDAEELEHTVNEWLNDNLGVDVMHMTQSESAVADEDGDLCGNTTLTLLYRRTE